MSADILRGCLYVVIKANEIENYRATGYLVKVITGNISSDFLKTERNKDNNMIALNIKNREDFIRKWGLKG